jgi:Methylamine utilisation protein MauE
MPVSAYLETFAFMGALVVRLAVAWIFAQSALHALRNLPVHTAIIEQYRLVPEALTAFVAFFVPATMLAVAVGLLVSTTASAAALLGAMLMAMFSAAIAINLARGRAQIDCGCGGAPGQQLSSGLVVRNVILAALLLCVAFAPYRGAVDAAVVIGVLGGAGTFVGFYFATDALLNNRSVLRGRGR